MPWRLTYPGARDSHSKTGYAAPSWHTFDRRVWEDEVGRILELTHPFGSKEYRVTLMSPSGGLLVLREGKSWQPLVAGVMNEARKLSPGEVGESFLEKVPKTYHVRTGDAHPRDLEEADLFQIEEYEVKCLRESREGLRLNGRLVLALIREVRRRRAEAEPARKPLIFGSGVLGGGISLKKKSKKR